MSYIERIENTYFGRWIKNYKISFLVVFLIAAYGLYSLIIVPKESAPTIKFGIVQISTIYPGTNPLDIDDSITSKIEDKVKDLQWIDKINSTSFLWWSNIVITLKNDVSTKDFINEVRTKVDSIVLPQDANKPVVTELWTDNQILSKFILYAPKRYFTMNQLRWLALDFKEEIKWKWWIVDVSIDGVAWDSAYDVSINLDQSRLEELWVSISSVIQQIRAYNQNLPLWNHIINNKSYDYRITNSIESLKDIQDIPINIGTTYVQLWEIASISRKYKVTSEIYWWSVNSSGNFAIEMTLFKAPKSNIFKVWDQAKQIIAETIKKIKFSGINVQYTADLADTIIDDYGSLGRSWIQSILLILFVTALFTWFWQSLTATVVMIIAFFMTFIVLNLLWLSLNFLTNFSLILAFGTGIDTIVVFIEWAYSNMKRWFEPKTAILLAINTYKSANINTSLINICVYIPLLVLPWVTGKFLSYIPTTIFTTLVASLILSLTISWALYYKVIKPLPYFYKNNDDETIMNDDEKEILIKEQEWKYIISESKTPWVEKQINRLTASYVSWLDRAMHTRRRRNLIIWLPIVWTVLSFVFLSSSIWFKLFPSWDNPAINYTITSPEWTTTQKMVIVATWMDRLISSIPELKSYTISVENNQIDIATILVKKAQRSRDSFAIQADIENKLAYLKKLWYRVEWKVQAWWPPTWKAVGIKLVANDKSQLAQLTKTASDFEEYLRSQTGTVNVANSNKSAPGQFEIIFDKQKLAQLWITPQDIQWELFAAVNGQKAWTVQFGWVEKDIIVRYDSLTWGVIPENISNMLISTRSWPVMLSSIATLRLNQSLVSISRQEWKIIVSVEADAQNDAPTTQLQQWLETYASNYAFPPWISFLSWWENEANKDLISAVISWFLISLFLAFILLVYQFNSFVLSSIVLYSIISAFLWVNLWLRITGKPYSMSFAIWFISLIWLVVTTWVFLIDRIVYNLDHGAKDIKIAILEAWSRRFRPILISWLITLLSAITIVAQDEFYAWLWYTIIFGLVFSATITLFAIPMLMYKIKVRQFPIQMKSENTI